jgi:hypothetical protein
VQLRLATGRRYGGCARSRQPAARHPGHWSSSAYSRGPPGDLGAPLPPGLQARAGRDPVLIYDGLRDRLHALPDRA